MSKELEKFGKIFISHVRDNTIHHYKKSLYGKKSVLHNKNFTSLNNEEKQIMENIVMETIDLTMFNLLNMFEEYSENLKLVYKDTKDIEYNIEEISGGIMGELFTEDGWIAKFSKYEESSPYN